MADIKDEGSSSIMADLQNEESSSDSKVVALHDIKDEDAKADSNAGVMREGLYDGAVLTPGAAVDINYSVITETRSISWEDAIRLGSMLLPPLSPPLHPWGHSNLVERAYDVRVRFEEYIDMELMDDHIYPQPYDDSGHSFGDFPPARSPFWDSYTLSSNILDSPVHPQDSHSAQEAMELGSERYSHDVDGNPQVLPDPFLDRNMAENAQDNSQFAQAVAVDESQLNLNDYILPRTPTSFGGGNNHVEGGINEEQEARTGGGQISLANNNWDEPSSAGEPYGQDADDPEWKSSPPQASHQQLQGLSPPSLGEPSQRSASLMHSIEPDQTYSEGLLADRAELMRRRTIADLQLPTDELHRNNNVRTREFTNEELIIAGRMYLDYKAEFGFPPPRDLLEEIDVLLNSEFTSWLDDRYYRMCEVQPELQAPSPLDWEELDHDIELELFDVRTFSITQQEFDAELEASFFVNNESALESENKINSSEDVVKEDHNITSNEDSDADSSSIENATIPLEQVSALQRAKSAETIVDCIPSNANFDTNLDGHPTKKASVEETALAAELQVNLTKTIGDDTPADVDMEMVGAPAQNVANHHAELPALQPVSRSTSTETIRNAITSDLDLNGNSHRDNKAPLEEKTNQDLEPHVTSSESTSGNTPASVQDAAPYRMYMDVGLGLSPNEKTVAFPDLDPVLEKEPQKTSAATVSRANDDMVIDIDNERPAKKACLGELENTESKLKGSPTEKTGDASAANVNIIDSHQSEKASLGESKGFASSFQYTATGTIHGTSSSENSHDVAVDRYPVEKSGLGSEPQGSSTEAIPEDKSNVSKFDTCPDRLNFPVTSKTAKEDLDQAMEVDNDDEVSLIQTSPIRTQSPIPIPKPNKYDKLLRSTCAPSALPKKSTKNIFAAVESRKVSASYMQAPTAGSSWSWGGGSPMAQPIQPRPFNILPACSSSDTPNFGSPPYTQNPSEPAAIPPPRHLEMNSASPVPTEARAQPLSFDTAVVGSPSSQAYDNEAFMGQGGQISDSPENGVTRRRGGSGDRYGHARQMESSQSHWGRSLRSNSDSAYANPNMTQMGSSPFGYVSQPSLNLSVSPSPSADASQPSHHYSPQDSSPTPGLRKNKSGSDQNVLLPNPSGLPSKPPRRLASLRPRESLTGNTQVGPSRPQVSPPSTNSSLEIGILFLNNHQSARGAAKALRDACEKEGKPFTIKEDFDMEDAKVIVSAPAGSNIGGWIKKHVVFGRLVIA